MDRSPPLLAVAIAIALAGWGVHRALFLPGLVAPPVEPLLLIGFLLQAVLGIAAGVGVWRGAAWAPLVIVLLGVSIAATALTLGLVLQVLALMRALLEAVVALLACLALAAIVRGSPRHVIS